MTIARGRVIKGAFPVGRRIPREALDARAEAERILEAARRDAARVAEESARDAREAETARLAAQFLALRRAEDARAERDLDRAVELATILAERLIGEGLRLEPLRVAELAASALAEARGARRVRIDANPDDVDALRTALSAASHDADVQGDPELPRGSLIVHTDLGDIDARLRPQLGRLAAALREAMR